VYHKHSAEVDMNITVYLGSRSGNREIYKETVKELGAYIGDHGHTLVYGGSSMGLMGALADAVLEHGGKVIGVEPVFFIEAEAQHDQITELIVTKDMQERKAKMIELGDAFIAFPGGIGTLDEISEIMTMHNLNHTKCPCIFLNINGFYEPMKAMLRHMAEEGFVNPAMKERISFADTIEELDVLLKRRPD